MILAALKNLDNCNHIDRCVCVKRTPFIESNASHFFVRDKEPVEIVAEKPYNLIVLNPYERNILLLKTDHCLLPINTSVCDCILTDDHQTFVVEMKTCTTKNRAQHRDKAVEQLEATLKYLRKEGVIFKYGKCIAFICFMTTEPKIIQASQMLMRAKFASAYKVDLQEGNKVEF